MKRESEAIISVAVEEIDEPLSKESDPQAIDFLQENAAPSAKIGGQKNIAAEVNPKEGGSRKIGRGTDSRRRRIARDAVVLEQQSNLLGGNLATAEATETKSVPQGISILNGQGRRSTDSRGNIPVRRTTVGSMVTSTTRTTAARSSTAVRLTRRRDYSVLVDCSSSMRLVDRQLGSGDRSRWALAQDGETSIYLFNHHRIISSFVRSFVHCFVNMPQISTRASCAESG